jgi:hypothetical protein
MQDKITRDDIDTYVSNIIAMWNRATSEQLAAGRAWYSVARDIASIIGNGDVRLGSGLIAALSPMTQWSLNVRNAAAIAAGEPVGTLSDSLVKATRILSGEDFSTVLPAGSKTWNFAHNITGESDHVTVDRWAIRIALGWDKNKLKDAQYVILADAYRKAAAEIGETASTVQAVTWCAIRGTGD